MMYVIMYDMLCRKSYDVCIIVSAAADENPDTRSYFAESL